MTKEELIQIFEAYLSAKSKVEEAASEYDAAMELPVPEPLTIVADLDAFFARTKEIEDHDRKIKSLEMVMRGHDNYLGQTARTICSIIPWGVWFKFGDIGIGVASTFNGGHWVETALWSDAMPSLEVERSS